MNFQGSKEFERMKKLALGALFVGLVGACGDDGGKTPTFPDSGPGGDGGNPIGTCSPTAQTGCEAGEKCTWIVDNEDPYIAHTGCAPDGNVEQFGSCSRAPSSEGGYDNCVAGTVCIGGQCKPICDTNGGDPQCPTNYSCVRYADFLEDGGGNSLGGVCEPGCDPLTQKLLVGDREACGSADPTAPTLGCYGLRDFSCSRAGELTKTHGVDAAENGTVYLNSCAPGYMPLWDRSSTDSTVICNGLCAAQPIDTEHQETLGRSDAEGKLVTQPAARVGDATCAATRKGSGNASYCIYFYPYIQDNQGNIPASFEPYLDLGFCFDWANHPQDLSSLGGPANYPWGGPTGCKDLPAESPDPNMPWLGASFWWCQPADVELRGTQTKRARMPLSLPLEEVELRRHTLL
jgi:hypothetical protein